MLNLFWIFEYVTSGPFAGLLSVDFTHVKKVQRRFSAMCILNFDPKTSIKMYSPEVHFFVFALVNWFPTYGQLSIF